MGFTLLDVVLGTPGRGGSQAGLTAILSEGPVQDGGCRP